MRSRTCLLFLLFSALGLFFQNCMGGFEPNEIQVKDLASIETGTFASNIDDQEFCIRNESQKSEYASHFWFVPKSQIIRGWAIDTRNPCFFLEAKVYIDGNRVGSLVANKYSSIYSEAVGRWAYHGFVFSIDSKYIDGTSHKVKLVESGTNNTIFSRQIIFK